MAGIKPSLFDRVLREISPARAVKRLSDKAWFDSMRAGGYDAAIDNRFRKRYAWERSRPGTEDFILGSHDRATIRLECRDLWRNNEIVRGLVNRFVDYAVWTGLFPQAKTSDPKWNKLADSWWNDIYVPTADHRQIKSVDLITLQEMVVSHRILDGECGFILLANGQVQAIEADRIATPAKFAKDKTVTEGIRRTKTGVTTGYFISPRKDGGAVDTTKAKFVRRENFIHSYCLKRIDQIRGVPDLAPAVNKLKDYDETDEAVLNKIKDDAYQQFKRKTETGLPNERARGSYTKTDSTGKDPQRVEKHEWGRVHNLRVNEDMTAFESKTPNSQYVPYLKHELQAIASCLNISYEYLMLIFTQGSFSSQRAAMLHSHHTFRKMHDWIEKSFLNRLWNWRIAKAMKNGELPLAPVDKNGRSEWYKKDWSLPEQYSLDPDKAAKADAARYRMGSTSLKSIVRSQGRERDDVLDEKTDDIQAAIERANRINKKYGTAVTWRDIIGEAAPAPPGPALLVEKNEEAEKE